MRTQNQSPYCRQRVDLGSMPGLTHLRAMLPLRANDMAFMNSVVLGTRANKVRPRNFSSIPDPFSTTSTTSTKISASQLGLTESG